MKFHCLIVTLLLSFFTNALHADTLFEGWYEVFSGGKKVGFLVERYDFENNRFKATTYLKTNADGNDVTESVKAIAAADLSPISYGYTMKMGDTIKVIDASFKGQVMNLTINDGKKVEKKTKRIEKGTFLSTFLLYIILSQKDGGLALNKSYHYNAVAEEDGTVYMGKALVSAMDKVKGRDTFKMLNEYKKDKFFTWITSKGEILLTRSPENNIEIRFAENQAQATEGIVVKNGDLKLLFGDHIPGAFGVKSGVERTDGAAVGAGASAGDDKEMKAKKEKLFEKHDVKPGKDVGVPGGQGIMIKGAPAPSPAP